MLGELTAEEIDGVLAAEQIARLAYSKDGQPYVLPVAYVFDGEALYVHSLEGTKVAIMRSNPRVAIQVDQVEHLASWRSVMGIGVFQELKGDEAKSALRRLIDRLMPGSSAADPFSPPGLEHLAVLFRVRFTERTGRFATP